jgi:ATP-dependent protease HslVU (ClpYQ) peptidase subunit
MTTLLACVDGGQTTMAADTYTTICGRPQPDSARKIRQYAPTNTAKVLLGTAGDGSIHNILDGSGFELPTLDHLTQGVGTDTDWQRWANQTAYRIHRTVSPATGAHLLACANRLWTLLGAQAIFHPAGRAALGTGADAALGALEAFVVSEGTDREWAVGAAVRIACRLDVDSNEPIQTETI